MQRIVVINPNSTESVTQAMEASISQGHWAHDVEVVFTTLSGAPPGIETQEHIDSVIEPSIKLMNAYPADAYVIGCFSDPGLEEMREASDGLVFGIGESSYFFASEFARPFGIISIVELSIGRHLKKLKELGLDGHLAGDRAMKGGTKCVGSEGTFKQLIDLGSKLRDLDGAKSIVLGCSSLGQYRPELESLMRIPVIDPTQIAVSRAVGSLSLGY